jgi:peptidoglycan/LPS O-acetylase OafA/YrhL
MTKTDNNPTLDGIRGWAFLIVLVMHGFSICFDGSQQYLQGCGKYGVWLFFVLSSFLLTKNYVLTNGNKREYMLGRVFRILPLYFICIAIYSGLNIIQPTISEAILTSVGLFGPLHLWTIPVEFCFYMILLVLLFVPNQSTRNIIMLCMAAGSLISLTYLPKDPSSINVFWYIPSFYCGYILAVLIPRYSAIRFGIAIPLVILAGFIFLNPGIQFLLFKIEPSPYLMNMYFPLSILWGIFILTVLNTRSKYIDRIFQSRLLLFLGKISYSGYLFHLAIMMELRKIMGSSILTVFISIVLSIIIGYLVNRTIEMPLYKIRKILLTSRAE